MKHQLAFSQVADTLKNWHGGIGRPVYYIVGLLISDQVRYIERPHTQSASKVEAKPPTKLAAAGMGTPAPNLEVVKIEGSRTKETESDVGLNATGTRILAIEYRVLKKRLLSTSGQVDTRPGGVRGDRTFARDEDQTGTSEFEQQQVEVNIDGDPLPDVEPAAEKAVFHD